MKKYVDHRLYLPKFNNLSNLRHFIKHTSLISEEWSLSINITNDKDEHYFK